MRQPKLLDREPSQAGCPVLQEPALQSGRLGPSQREFKPLVVRDSANPRASPGGTPEPYDSGLVATLVREAFEENQVRVDEAAYLGYQEGLPSRTGSICAGPDGGPDLGVRSAAARP